jgi:SAM-dependent methyltransferase
LTTEILRAGAGVVGVDLSLKNLRKVKERVDSESFYPVVADICRPPFRDEPFEVIFLLSLLEHLEVPEKALRESEAFLRERGCVVIIVPYREKIRYHLCIHCNRPTPGFAHLHSFDEFKLLNLLEASGLMAVHRERFANKLLDFFAAGRMLRRFPFGFWRTLDKLLNLILPRMEFLLVVAKARKLSGSV